MRFSLQPDNATTRVLRGMLEKAGYAVSDIFPHYVLHLIEEPGLCCVIVDGVDCEFERHVINEIAGTTDIPILVQRAGGNRSATAMVVKFNPVESPAIERGVFRAVMREMNRPRWWQFWRFL